MNQETRQDSIPTTRSSSHARRPARPSVGGGKPAQDRILRTQGRETVRRLLEAGLVEFEERGFPGVRVDDVVKRAGISHGTFYLYFSNKEDLFRAYTAHGTVLRTLSAANAPREIAEDGVRLFFSLAETMNTGMTAAIRDQRMQIQHVELAAVACLMMLERVNYLISTEMQFPEEEMVDCVSDIIYAAFAPVQLYAHPHRQGDPRPA
jgi:AcrR family transcriptional regulator